ncbi:mitochondrial inner membrane protein OXA1L-like isoform X2 [Lineus longissimus]|uniref:mitochondrial inner membrane protein OXA1L-like isoform X2 n=1 Tax=Lineus longissimus TaxID=88925 RepID=UPI002B4D29EE
MAALLRHARFVDRGKLLFSRYITVEKCLFHSVSENKIVSQLQVLPRSRQSCYNNQMKMTQPLMSCMAVRFSSAEVIKEPVLAEAFTAGGEYIPPPPTVPTVDPLADIGEVALNALGEPTFASLGLGSWWPPGLVQSALELLHVSCDLPWWSAIVVGTVIVRMCMFPLVVKSQKNAAKLNNNMPTMTRLQERFTEARQSGNPMEAAKCGQELMDFMKRNEINPLKNFLVPLAQMPVFISVFVGMRQMANLPVPSLKEGGLFWFTDLTCTDPYFALPALTALTFYLTIELGVDGVRAGSAGNTMKYVMRAMPLLMFPFIMKFPAAMLVYWFTSNAFSLCQVALLKIPAVRAKFGIEQLVKHPAHLMPKKKGFVQGVKEN